MITESTVEEAALSWLGELGYAVLPGPEIAPGELFAERRSYQEVILHRRLRDALARLNPAVPADAVEDAFRRVSRVDSPSLVQGNRIFHRMLVDGVDVEYRSDGRIVHDKARLVDFEGPGSHAWPGGKPGAGGVGERKRPADTPGFSPRPRVVASATQ